MIDGLVSGKLFGTATSRQGRGGGTFVTCKVRAAVDGGESLFVNVIAFSATVGDALLALDDGDSIALTGALTPKAWVDRQGAAKPALDLVAHAVLTAYQVKRKRAAVHTADQARQVDTGASADDMNDDI